MRTRVSSASVGSHRTRNPVQLFMAALAVAGLMSGCATDLTRQNDSPVIMIVTKITGISSDGEEGDILISDICCAIQNDDATVNLAVLSKNQNLGDVGEFNDVLLQRYEVRFTRSDGRNVEGVDVPFHFTGPLNTRITAPGTGAVIVSIVRHQAKLEPPLKNLRQSDALTLGQGASAGGALFITTIAEITIHGVTVSGKVVSAQGRLQVTFADFAGEG